jgi:hypothetical protein
VATPQETKASLHQALKGRDKYSALSGLAMMITACVLWRVPQAITFRPFGAFSNCFSSPQSEIRIP